MAKTNWQMGDTVMPSDLNELGREVNESAAALEEHATAVVLDHPDNSVTDAKIGNRTISDAAAPDGDTAAPTKLWSWLAYMIKSITGKSSWRTPPATTLEAAKTHMDAVTNVHGATSAATPNRLIIRDAAGRAKVAAPVANDDIARKAEVDAALTAIDSRTRYGVTSGTGTAYTLTLSPALSSLYTGIEVKIKFHTTNTGNPTLNINGLGAKSLRNAEGAVFTAGDLESNRVYTFVYDGTNFILCSGGGDEVRINFNEYYYHNEKKYTQASAVMTARSELAATITGNYALFAGGRIGDNTETNAVDAFDTALVRTIPATLTSARRELGATSVGGFALFGGGFSSTSSVNSYDANLVRSIAPPLASARSSLAATTIGEYALFAGGSTGLVSAEVDAYDANLVRSTPLPLTQARYDLSAAAVGNYALFVGGFYSGGGYSTVVNAYSADLVRSTPASTSISHIRAAATTVGNYAIFGGRNTSVLEAYNTSLVRSTTTPLFNDRTGASASSVNGYALFAGGGTSAGASNVIDSYSPALVRTLSVILTVPRSGMAATALDGYAFFAGGIRSVSSFSNAIEAINYDYPLVEQWITIGSKYNFGNGEQIATSNKITLRSPVTGYIKLKKGAVS